MIIKFKIYENKKSTRKCDICGKEYEYDSKQKSKYCSDSCRTFAFKQRRIKGDINSDYVICKICSYKFKEINNDHLMDRHGITCEEYDRIYGQNERISEKTRNKKNTLSVLMNSELSKKLSNSHKLDNYIKKYGDIDGPLKYKDMLDRKKYKNGLKSYIDKYGEDLGIVKFKETQSKKGVTLENQIKLHGLDIGTDNYDKWKKIQKIKNTLPHYIEKYGDEVGLEKWLRKNDKISLANSKINLNERKEYIDYVTDVNRFTRLSLNQNTIIMIELRGLKHGYDLDHMVSKIDGFNNNVPPYIIGHFSNLIIINSSLNRSKRHKSNKEISYITEECEKDIKYMNIVNKLKNINIIKESKVDEYNKINAAYDFIKSQIKGTEWDNKVYAAGGYVRDELMGITPKDLDLMVDKEDGGIEFAEWITKKIGVYRENSNPVIYPRFGTAKFNLRGIQFNGYNLSDVDIESVMPRSEKYKSGSREPDVEFSTLKKDSERRDLTVNSMFKNLTNDEILDLTGMGKDDLKKGLVRSPIDPDIIFDEDPLRMLRVIRTTIKYNWDLPWFMIRSIKKNAKKLEYISSERIQDELNKMLVTSHPDKAIRLLQITKLSKYIFPELDKLIKMKQNKFHKYDAMRHTLEVLKNTPPDLITRLAALFHDIGKTKTKEIIDSETHFYRHEEVGSFMVRDIMKRLHYPKEIIEAVATAVGEHMRTKHAGDEGDISDRSLRKLKQDLGDHLQHTLDLIHADNVSHADDANMPNQISNIRRRFLELEEKDKNAPKKSPLNGDEIQDILGIGKGPIVGKILKILGDMYLDDPYMTRDELVHVVKKSYEELK